MRFAAPFDLDRLDAEQRALWDEYFAPGPSEEGEVVRVMGFAQACTLELTVPEVVGEYLTEHRDSIDRIHQYAANVRAAREEGR